MAKQPGLIDRMIMKLCARYRRSIRFALGLSQMDDLGGRSYAPPDTATQLLLRLHYEELLRIKAPLPPLSEVGFKAYSQSDEDGLLHYIFSLIGTTNKKCVEIAPGDGSECNTANLIIHHGWHALLVDCDERNVESGKAFFHSHRTISIWVPQFVHARAGPDNVNRILSDRGFVEEIDLLSIDIDGMDYWLWNAIEVVNPRVVVIEYMGYLGPNQSWTMPYDESYRGIPEDSLFSGASLSAFVNLARRKGYRLVGSNSLCFNAFFVRNDLGADLLPEVAPATCFDHPYAQRRMAAHGDKVQGFPWVEV